MEISNSERNPDSMFESALPSLKISCDQANISDDQKLQLEEQRRQLQDNLSRQNSRTL